MKTPTPLGLHGPFYWLYLRPKWVLKYAPVPATEDTLDHVQFWERLVDQELIPFYAITASMKVAALKNLPYSMPRGRVQALRGKDGEWKWAIYHGQDFKLGKSRRCALLKAVGLVAAHDEGRVSWVFDEHEQMLATDRRQMMRMLGLTILPK